MQFIVVRSRDIAHLDNITLPQYLTAGANEGCIPDRQRPDAPGPRAHVARRAQGSHPAAASIICTGKGVYAARQWRLRAIGRWDQIHWNQRLAEVLRFGNKSMHAIRCLTIVAVQLSAAFRQGGCCSEKAEASASSGSAAEASARCHRVGQARACPNTSGPGAGKAGL
jgi:hypothetical protein